MAVPSPLRWEGWSRRLLYRWLTRNNENGERKLPWAYHRKEGSLADFRRFLRIDGEAGLVQNSRVTHLYTLTKNHRKTWSPEFSAL